MFFFTKRGFGNKIHMGTNRKKGAEKKKLNNVFQ